MSKQLVPVDSKRTDWPRLVANAVNSLLGRADALGEATDWAALQEFPDDAAAATGGVAIGQLYRTGSSLKVRVV